jgi:hypothetical protein
MAPLPRRPDSRHVGARAAADETITMLAKRENPVGPVANRTITIRPFRAIVPQSSVKKHAAMRKLIHVIWPSFCLG